MNGVEIPGTKPRPLEGPPCRLELLPLLAGPVPIISRCVPLCSERNRQRQNPAGGSAEAQYFPESVPNPSSGKAKEEEKSEHMQSFFVFFSPMNVFVKECVCVCVLTIFTFIFAPYKDNDGLWL